MLEVLGEDYIRTAKAKGLSYTRIVIVHALRNALIPVVTVVGLIVGQLLSGAVLTETIFSWPGIGKWIIVAISNRVTQSYNVPVLIISYNYYCGEFSYRFTLWRGKPTYSPSIRSLINDGTNFIY